MNVSHARTASPRPHARHARNENEDETKPISRLRGVGQAGLAPPNLRFLFMAVFLFMAGGRTANLVLAWIGGD